MKMKITDSAVAAIEPPATGYTLHWDTALPGFGVRVSAGGTKQFIAQGDVRAGGKRRKRRETLGRHGVMKAREARDRARAMLVQMRDGKDPVEERKREAARQATLGITLCDVVEDFTTNKLVRGRPLKDSYKARIRKRLDKQFKRWADRPLSEITRAEVVALNRSIKSNAEANDSMRILRALLNYAAEEHGRKVLALSPDGIHENPVPKQAKIARQLGDRSTRKVPLESVGVWWSALQALRADPAQTRSGRTGADLVAFLTLTGLRLSEATGLTWDRVDLEVRTFRLEDTKNRTSPTFPLSDAAWALLKDRPQEGVYVFPGRKNPETSHVNDTRGTFRKLEEVTGVRAKVVDHQTGKVEEKTLIPHDLRRTFLAVAGAVGIDHTTAKLLANHTVSGDVTLIHYTDKSDLTRFRPQVNAIAEWLETKAREHEAGNVVPFRRSAS